MPEIQISKVHAEQLTYFAPENLSFAALPAASFVSSTVNRIEPGVTQTPHYHNRPQQGEEIVFVYQGTFELIGAEGVIDSFNVEHDGPIYLHIPAQTQASLRNVGDTPVRFFSLFAPPFVLEEMVFLTKHTRPDSQEQAQTLL